MKIRPAVSDDIAGILEMEQASLTAAHWSDEQYRRAIGLAGGAADRILLVADTEDSHFEGSKLKNAALLPQNASRERGGTLVGFLVARHVSEEWELENIVVAPEFRIRGIGRQLVGALLARVRETPSRAVFLEVRESNVAARKLYQKAGFREIGRRKTYYADPPEGAVLYCLEVK
jgi:ribosomal-protein-alanine acetyltransferase